MKKQNIMKPINNSEKIKVKFHRDYIGKLGTFYNGKIYELPIEIYQLLKIDCEKVE
jgi:hypothetical protein